MKHCFERRGGLGLPAVPSLIGSSSSDSRYLMKSNSALVALFAALAAVTALGVIPEAARGGQIFETNPNREALPDGYSTVGEYTTSGATVNASLVSGLNGGPAGIAVSGGNLFITNYDSGTVGEYTTSGATVNASLVSGLNSPIFIAASGGNLFITNNNHSGTVGEYDATSGATVNASLVSGLNDPSGIAVFGGDLFVANLNEGVVGSGTIGEYTTSGATVNASLISGLNDPVGIAVSGGD